MNSPCSDSPSTALRICIALLLVVMGLVLMHHPGTSDVPIFLKWAETIKLKGAVKGYSSLNMDYPPLCSWLLARFYSMGMRLGFDGLISIKFSILVVLVGTTCLFGHLTRNFALAIFFYMSLVIGATSLGYVDIYFAPFLLGAFWALAKGRYELFAILYSLACMIKWQPVIIGPFLAMHCLRVFISNVRSRADWLMLGRRCALPALAVLAPIFFIYQPQPIYHSLINTSYKNHFLSGFALNLQWIISHIMEILNPDEHGPLKFGHAHPMNSPSALFTTLNRLPFLLSYGFLLFRAWRSPLSVLHTLGWCLLGFLSYFFLNTGVHENHLFIPLLIVFFLSASGVLSVDVTIAMAIMMNLNQTLFYGFEGQRVSIPGVPGSQGDVLLVTSVINCVAFGVIFYHLTRRLQQPSLCKLPIEKPLEPL